MAAKELTLVLDRDSRLEKIAFGAGDVAVLTVQHPLSDAQTHHAQTAWEQATKGLSVKPTLLLLDDGCDLATVPEAIMNRYGWRRMTQEEIESASIFGRKTDTPEG